MEEKKKVLHIVEAFGGGVFTVLNDLINGTSNEYEIVIAYSVRPQTPKNFKSYFNSNVKFIEVKNFTRSINVKKDFKALQEIKRIVKEEKPDIVHLHSSKAGILGRLAVNGSKIKMFYNPHGFSFLKQDDSWVKRSIYWLIEKVSAMFNKKCIIIGCSKGEYIEAKKLNKNSICINNGIDIDKLNKETAYMKDKEIDFDNIKICTVGRIEYQKNPEMFNKIASEFPNIQFTWIGDGDLKDKLTSPNIQVTGWKSREELLEILNKQDIFILTSLWEGLPISLLEAMYMKKICIVSDVIGNKDVIINGQNGFVIKDENYREILKYINLNNFENVEKIKNNAYNDIMNNYSTKIMVEKYRELYKRQTKYMLKQLIKQDKQFYLPKNKYKKRIFQIITNHNNYAIYKSLKIYRKYNFYKQNNNYLFMILYGRKKNKIIQKYNLELCLKIGRNLRLPHRNVIINDNSEIGDNVCFHGFNVVGNNSKDSKAPKIGNNVDIGVGSIIIGDVYIADNCIIGANSLVNKSCYEEGSVLVGSPAHRINKVQDDKNKE